MFLLLITNLNDLYVSGSRGIPHKQQCNMRRNTKL
jgi:hypothetical protein